MNRIILIIVVGMLFPLVSLCYSYSSDNQVLRKKLAEEETIFFYQINPAHSSISIQITNQQQQELIELPLPHDFQDRVMDFYDLLQDFALVQKSKRQKFLQESRYFYELLWQPFLPFFEQKTQITIIGEGVLQYVPFEVFSSNEEVSSFIDADFLIKKHYFSYFFTLSDYLQHKQQFANTKFQNWLGFAPVFEKSDIPIPINRRQRSRASHPTSTLPESIPPLPYSESELQHIQRIFPTNSSLLLRQKARKQTLKKQLQQPYQLIHLATHSFADFSDEHNSGIICAGGQEECAPDYEILRVKEIEQLQINADLVVLSSCQSGVGKLTEEGVQGIHRSFIKAGAKNVVFSLWKVNDEICSQFMQTFYQEIAAGKTYSSALQIAKLSLLESPSTASPNIWGAFLMIGK